MSCSGSRCSNIYTLTCQDIHVVLRIFSIPNMLLWVAKNLGSAAEILQAGVDGLAQQLRKANVRSHKPTLEKIVAWARSAPSAEEPASLHRRFFIDLDADRLAKLQVIRAIESELAETLSQTPYVLLLSIPGINVVSAAEFAGEMGPIKHYVKARAITGRAGLYPSRYQSDEVDHPRRTVGATRQPRPAACDPHDRRQPDQVQRALWRLGRGMAGQEGGRPRYPRPGWQAASAGSPSRWCPVE